MPDYRGAAVRPFDRVGFVLFGGGVALLSWVLEVFGEHRLDAMSAAVLVLVSLSLLATHVLHAARTPHPLLRLALLRVRTFHISVAGGFVTRLGVGGLPLLLPLRCQLAMGSPAWQSGLPMMPTAAAAMVMKPRATRVLQRFGYRTVLLVDTVLIGSVIGLYALVDAATPLPFVVALGLAMGLFNSLQVSSMNSMAYADIADADSSQASTMASAFQQLSMSFGLAFGSLVTAWFLGDLPQTDRAAVANALHHAFLALGALTLVSSLSFRALRARDGENVSRGAASRPG